MPVSVTETAPRIDHQTPEAALLRHLAEAFEMRHTDPAAGERLATEIGRIADDRGLEHVRAVSNVSFAYCAEIVDAPEDGIQQLKNAVEVCGRVHDVPNQVRAADLLATIFEGTGEYSDALSYAEIALEGARSTGDRLFEACALSSLAGVFIATGDLEIAEKKTRLALDIVVDIGSRRMESRLYYRLGCIARKSGDMLTAKAALEKTKIIGREVGSLFSEAEALTELGGIYETEGRFDEAEAVLLEARAIAERDADVKEVVYPTTQIALARVYGRTGRREAARDVLQGFGERSSLFDLYPTLAEGSKLLAETYDALGEERSALEQYRRHVKYRERAMVGEAQRAVHRYQVKLHLAAAEREAEHQRSRYRELEAIQTQLVEAERRAAVGILAAGLAHEMNTPIGAVKSSLDTIDRAQQRITDEVAGASLRVQSVVAAIKGAHDTSREAVTRLQELVRSLRRFTRLDEADVQNVDLNDCVDAAWSLLPATLCEGLVMERALVPLPRIRGWPGRINQALLTLMVNAAEVQAGRGRLRVETAYVDGDCVIRVIDEGPGIPRSVQARLFDLAFDTTGSRARFRVGLATVRSVMLGHGGAIDFETGAHGTTFILKFPTE